MRATVVACPQCGAEYERTINKVIFRDQDSFECLDCGHQLERWSTSRYPSYRKIKDAAEKGTS